MKTTFILLISIFISISFFVNNNNYIWATSAGSETSDFGRSVAVDSNGDYYVIGEIPRNPTNADSIVDFGNGATLILDDGNSVFFIVKYNEDNQTQWVEGIAANGNPKFIDIIIDNVGSIYVTGYFFHSATFGGTTTITSNSFAFSTFVAKYNSNGDFQWVKNTDSPTQSGSVIVLDLATDGNSVYTTGYFNNTFTFGGSTISSNGSSDIFIAKISSSGTVNWLKGEGGSEGDRGYGIDFNGTNVNVCGYFRGTATIAGNTIDANGAADFFVAQYNTSGTPIWIDHAGSTSSSDRARGITSNANGDVFLCGEFGGTMTVGDETINSTAGTDAFIIKYDSFGAFQWIEQSEGSGNVSNGNIVLNSEEEIIFYGEHSGELTIEGTTLNSSSWQGFLARYQGDGAFICLDQLNDNSSGGSAVKPKIGVGNEGKLFKPGSFDGTLILSDSFTLVSNGGSDMYIYILGPVIVPVTLSNFNLLQNKNNVVLHWSTYSETGFDKFEIQKKIDQQEFKKIGETKGIGGYSVQGYSFTDTDINTSSTIYYRLKIIDLDGSFEYSPVRTLDFKPISSSPLSIYPNPALDQIFIKGLSKNEGYIITIIDQTGREIKTLNFNGFESEFNISELQEGAYVLKLENLTTKAITNSRFIKSSKEK